MRLDLYRRWKYPDTMIGELFIDGVHFGYTCEDGDRSGADKVLQAGEKIAGKTCIPTGTYKVVLTFSERFQRVLPLLVGVPLFAGIRIHPGNTNKDTDGCILVGKYYDGEKVTDSKAAFEELMKRLTGEKEITIVISEVLEP